jgi:hypothetical protein
MWGTSLPEDKLTGNLGNVIEANIDRRSSVGFFYSGKISAGQFGTFATISARTRPPIHRGGYLLIEYPASSYNQGTTFTKDMINDLPIPEMKPNERAKLISCVDRIIVAKQRDAEADASALESEIDRLVYALYDLTSQEIQIVEGAVN